MTQNVMPKEWQNWVTENLGRGCDPNEICQRLVDSGFDMPTIKQAMGAQFPGEQTTQANNGSRLAFDQSHYQAMANPRLTRPDNGLENVTRFPDDRLQLYLMEHALTDEECDRLVELISIHNRPSTITTQDTEEDKLFRTSSTCDMSRLDNDFIREIDAKLSRILGIQMTYSEGIQGQHYEVGQEFKAHTDYFTPGTDEFKRFASALGQRTWTFMVYLNDTEAGGGTWFTEIDQIFYPKKGLGVLWNNLNPDGTVNYQTKHWAKQVEKGTKTIITKWFREKPNNQAFYYPWE